MFKPESQYIVMQFVMYVEVEFAVLTQNGDLSLLCLKLWQQGSMVDKPKSNKLKVPIIASVEI